MANAGAVGAIGGHPKGWRGGGAPLLDGTELEVQIRPCVLLSRKPEAEVGQTTNWETRAVLIAMVKQESRQLVLKSSFRPSVRCLQSFCHGGSTEGSEDEFTCPKAKSVTRCGRELAVLRLAHSQNKLELAKKDIQIQRY